jgi:hypothetical protein
MPEQPGSPGVEEYRGIAFGEDQPPADAVAVYKHEPEVGRAFGLPAFRGESIDGGGHGKAQVGAGARSWVNQIAQVEVGASSSSGLLCDNLAVLPKIYGSAMHARHLACGLFREP